MAATRLRIAATALLAGGALAVGAWSLAGGHATAAVAEAPAAVLRDIAFGADPKQKLDVFAPSGSGSGRPVVIFAHGGGFSGGDKDQYDNIMNWAVANGMVGVNMNYRLAPAVTFPAQEEDVAAVVAWTKANIAGHGGDPNRLFLFGHSSGGANVANYAAMPQFRRDPAVKGLILLSSVVDLNIYDPPWPYFGTTDKARLTELSPQTNLIKSDLPLLMGRGDEDSVTIMPSVPAARDALCAAGKCPRFVITKGTHGGVARAIGAEGDQTFANAALAFISETR